jgi:hypothetical protein
MNAGPQVLRSGREPKAEGASRQPYSAAADISIRLWTPAQLHANPSDVSWKTGSNLVFMISDVVTATQGVPADELRSGMSAHFNSAAQALKAAKSIERSIAEFSRLRPDDCFGAAIVVHRPIELRPFLESDPGPVSPACALLREAQPGQILVSRETYEHLRDLPGLQFRPLTADAASGGNELLWTSPETYAEFATRLQEAIRRQPLRDDSEPATEIRAIEPPHTKASDLRAGAFSTARLSALDTGEPEVSWMASHRLLVSLAAVGVLALATVYALPALRKSSPAANSATRSQATDSPKTDLQRNDTQQPTKQEALPNNPPPVVPLGQEPAKVTPEDASQIRKPEVPRRIQPPAKPAEAKGVSEYAGFYAKDIPKLLQRAEQDAGNGYYDSSRHEYEIILQLDPNNAAARAGLSRVNLSVDRK